MNTSVSFSSVNIGVAMETLSRLHFSIEKIHEISDGFTASNFGTDENRLSWSELERFWQVAETITDDQFVGLLIGENYQPNSKSVIASLLMSSANIEEGMHRLQRYHKIIGEPTILKLEQSQHSVSVHYGTLEPYKLSQSQADYFCMQILKLTSWILGKKCTPIKIDFAHKEPQNTERYRRLIDCPINFSRKFNAVTFDRSVALESSPHANSHIADALETVAQTQISKLKEKQQVDLIVQAISNSLASDHISLDKIAQAINLSAKELNAILSNNDLTFTKLTGSARLAKAEDLLRNSDFSITDVAFLCGSHETSSFVRAFRRWHDMSPRDYRRTLC